MRKKNVIIAASTLVVLFAVSLFVPHDKPATPQLPGSEAAHIVINERHHTISWTERKLTRRGVQVVTRKETLAPVSTVDVDKHGRVTVHSPLFQFGVDPVLGAAYSPLAQVNALAAVDLLRVRSFNLGLGITAFGTSTGASMVVEGSYNILGNMVGGVFMDNHKSVGVFIGVRL